jgi:hypothetical protein
MNQDGITIGIDDEDDLVAARAAAEAHGVALREITGEPSGDLEELVEPVTMVLIGTAAVAGVKMVMDWWEHRRGGLVIDQRPGADPTIHRDRELPYGWIATYPADGGKVTVAVKDDPDAAEKWVSEVLKGVLGSAKEVADAAAKTVGKEHVTQEA